MKVIPLFLSQLHPCSYLAEQEARTAFVHPSEPMSTALYSELIKQGFRRSGDEVYTPQCPSCSACVPVRLDVNQFVPNRSQKRCLQKNGQTQTVILPAEYRQAHFDLYLRYQALRHEDGTMLHSSTEDYISFLGSEWCESVFVEFKVGGELAAVAVVDELNNALSAVYTFFDPKYSDYGLGTYAVLWQIDRARQLSKQFLYLGFWIKACKKMSYKSHYQPLQMLKDKQWQQVEQA